MDSTYYSLSSCTLSCLRTALANATGQPTLPQRRAETVKQIRERGFTHVRMDWVLVSPRGHTKVSRLTLCSGKA